jgi:hypothetical protein
LLQKEETSDINMAFVEDAGPFLLDKKALRTWNQYDSLQTKTLVLESPSKRFSAHLSFHNNGELRIWFETLLSGGCDMAHFTCEFGGPFITQPLMLPNPDHPSVKSTNWLYVHISSWPENKTFFSFRVVYTLSESRKLSLMNASPLQISRNQWDMFKNQSLVDVDLKLDDGTLVGAHKLVLSAASPVFATMFKTYKSFWQESKSDRPCIPLPMLSKESLEYICNRIYDSSSILVTQDAKNMNWEKWMEVIQTTHRFEMDFITSVAVDELGTLVSSENYATLAKFAHTFHLDNLTQLVTKFIAKHPDLILQQIIKSNEISKSSSSSSSSSEPPKTVVATAAAAAVAAIK